MIDSVQEKKIGVGRDWDLPALAEGISLFRSQLLTRDVAGEIYLSKRMSELVRAKQGSTVFMA